MLDPTWAIMVETRWNDKTTGPSVCHEAGSVREAFIRRDVGQNRTPLRRRYLTWRDDTDPVAVE